MKRKNNILSSISNVEVSFGIDRVIVIKSIILVMFFAISVRLFYMQVIDYDKYKAKASAYQDVIEKIPAKRGEIYVASKKEVDLKSMKTYSVSNMDDLDRIVSNVYKYNVVFNPKMSFNYSKLTDEITAIFGSKVIFDRSNIENRIILLNNSDKNTDKLLEILYPDLYQMKGLEEKIESLKIQKTELESKIKITKNKKTKKSLEDSLYSVNIALKISDEDKNKLELLKTERGSIFNKITKQNDAYEVIKKDIEEKQMEKIVSYFQDIYFNEFYPYIESLNSKVKENQLKVFYRNFLTFEKNESRLYSDSNLFSQVTGFLQIKEKEIPLKDGSIKYEKYGQGVYGLESYFNTKLKGTDGEVKGKYDLYGKLIATADRSVKDAKDGENLILTIDKSIQYNVCKELNDAVIKYEAEGGSILVMEPNTGAVLAMCNNPTFDANKYNTVEDISVFNNPIVTDQVEFGSIMKVITMATGIDTGAVTTDTTYEDTGCAKIGDWPKPICNADNSTSGAHGETGMIDVLNKSLNLGSWFVANKTGKENFIKYVNNFGFGSKTGIDLGNESKGDVRNLEKIVNKNGDIYLATASFGQGITMTQIQYLTAFASVVNGGKLMKPYIVKATMDSDGNIKETQPEFIRRTIKESTSTTMRGMLTSVIERGYDKNSQVSNYYVGGKTGTAQIAEKGVYIDKTMQSFVGFGPVDNPKFVIMIKLIKPTTKFASYSTTPVFASISKYLFDYYQIPPDKKD